MSPGVVRGRVFVTEGTACSGCGKPAREDDAGRFYLYRYRPFRGAPLVCSRDCDIRARPALELEGTGGPQ